MYKQVLLKENVPAFKNALLDIIESTLKCTWLSAQQCGSQVCLWCTIHKTVTECNSACTFAGHTSAISCTGADSLPLLIFFAHMQSQHRRWLPCTFSNIWIGLHLESSLQDTTLKVWALYLPFGQQNLLTKLSSSFISCRCYTVPSKELGIFGDSH